jgi:hypothetical protein
MVGEVGRNVNGKSTSRVEGKDSGRTPRLESGHGPTSLKVDLEVMGHHARAGEASPDLDDERAASASAPGQKWRENLGPNTTSWPSRSSRPPSPAIRVLYREKFAFLNLDGSIQWHGFYSSVVQTLLKCKSSTILAVGMSCDPAKLLLLGSGNLLIKDLIGVCRDRCDRWRVGHIKGMSVMTRKCCFAVLAIECFTNRPLSALLILVLSSNAKSLHLLGCLISDYHLPVAVV